MRYRKIISYPDMLQREKISLQKGMNFRVRTSMRRATDRSRRGL